MDLANALKELASRLGAGEVELDSSGCCNMVFDDESVVDLQLADEEPGFYMTGTVGKAPDEYREQVFAELLEANLQGRGVGRCCLAYDAEMNEIVLSRYFERDEMEVETLADEIEHFLTVLEVWKRRFAAQEIGAFRQACSSSQPRASLPENMIRP